MVWLKEICEDVVCGGALGIVKGVFGISLFTETETEEINSLKELALSVLEKSPEIVTESILCAAIQKGQKSALDTFTKNVSPEAVAAGVVRALQQLN